MRRLAIAAGAIAALAFACVDLFHDTDFASTPPIDASTPEAKADAPSATGDAAPLDFCTLDPNDAKARAQRACAMLAACQTPFGKNATGACLERALPAIGCKMAPGRVARGSALEFYRCLVAASSCDDVARCVFKTEKETICVKEAGAFTQCVPSTGAPALRADCFNEGPAVAEPCSDLGQICSGEGDYLGLCTGKKGRSGCTIGGCVDTFVVRCNRDGGDDGYDCALFGAGSCVATDAGGACVPNGQGCEVKPVECDSQGLVTGCIGGKLDRLSCSLFDGTCHDAGARAALDVREVCRVPGDAGCDIDRCSSNVDQLTACVLGNRITIDCKALVGTTCRQYETSDGTRFGCAKP